HQFPCGNSYLCIKERRKPVFRDRKTIKKKPLSPLREQGLFYFKKSFPVSLFHLQAFLSSN
ncbi:hypothetical protein, partial [Bacillus cereus group sp. BC23]|uniref:hypothetical protein n=1 Tax=Bacillus cereus group sp. BC23 TaxID=3445339 RepID=UPI003F1E6AFD